jgi:hypothetical protein
MPLLFSTVKRPPPSYSLSLLFLEGFIMIIYDFLWGYSPFPHALPSFQGEQPRPLNGEIESHEIGYGYKKEA